jgi:hypothetical protein
LGFCFFRIDFQRDIAADVLIKHRENRQLGTSSCFLRFADLSIRCGLCLSLLVDLDGLNQCILRLPTTRLTPGRAATA